MSYLTILAAQLERTTKTLAVTGDEKIRPCWRRMKEEQKIRALLAVVESDGDGV